MQETQVWKATPPLAYFHAVCVLRRETHVVKEIKCDRQR